MLRSLSFKADPPLPFHTYNYHLKKAIKEGYIDNYLDHGVRLGIIQQVVDGLIEIFAIPEDYHIILLKENRFLINSLASLVRRGTIIAGSAAFSDSVRKYANEYFNSDFSREDLSNNGNKILLHWDLENGNYTKLSPVNPKKEKTGKLTLEDLTDEKSGKLSPEDIEIEKTGKLSLRDIVNKDIGDMSLIIQDIDPMTGRKLRPDDLKESLDRKALDFIHLDISLSSPTDSLDYQNIQSFSFETKYGFGMDQDLVVWILREDLLNILTEKTSGTFMESDIGTTKSKNCIVQPEIEIHRVYVLGKIMQDFMNRGLTIIRNEIRYKSIILYNSISGNPNLAPLVNDPYLQSQNILCAHTEIPREKLFEFMSGNRIDFDVLSGPEASSNIRIANYPVHSKEQMEFLVDCLEQL
jgi:phosphoserine aminotransferase